MFNSVLRLSEPEQEALSIWRFDPQTRVLSYFNERGAWLYEVDLDRCRTSAELLDWIFQVAQKRWATDRVLAALIHAMNAVLRPQSTLCGCGQEHGPIDVPSVLAHIQDHRQKEACS